MLNRVHIYLLILGALQTFQSCEKFVEIEPKDRVTTSAAFIDSINSVSAIIGIYTDAAQNPQVAQLLNGGVSVLSALSSDELVANNSSQEVIEFYKNSIAPTNFYNADNLWKSAYQIIYKTNACIEGLEASNAITTSLKQQLLGEAKFLRAICYYYLVNLYSDVPYIKTTNYRVTATMPRTATAEIMADIQKELEEAKGMLSEQYPSSGRQRANKCVAQFLLSKIYLHQGKWHDTIKEASEIINNPAYILVKDLDRVFNPGSMEAIWQSDPIVKGLETAVGFFLVPYDNSSIPPFSINPLLFQAFEPNDKRAVAWLGKNTVVDNGNVVEYYYPRKYKLGYDSWSSMPLESYIHFRLAELYLVRAEAKARIGNIFGQGSAVEDVNVIRRRAQLNDTIPSSNDDIYSIIRHEKRVELFVEGGARWFDLKRTNTIDSVMNVAATQKQIKWNRDWALYPIPSYEIVSNPKLVQNDGYAQ